jgi:hypothetical protein
MQRSPSILAFALAVLAAPVLALPQAGQAPPSEASQAAKADEIAALVPKDAFFVLRIASLDEAQAILRSLWQAFVPEEDAEAINLRELLQAVAPGADLTLVAGDRPLAIAFSLDATSQEPVPTAILPIADMDAYKASLPEPGAGAPAPLVRGSYVAHSQVPGYQPAAEAPALALGAPAGTLAASVDLETLIETFRPMIEMGLDQAEQMMDMQAVPAAGMDPGEMIALYLDGVRAVLDSAERLDLSFAAPRGETDFGWSLSVAEGSPMAALAGAGPTSIRETAKLADGSAPMVMLFGFDMAKSMALFESFFDAVLDVYPEPARADLRRYMDAQKELYPLFGSSMAISGSFDAKGMRFAYFMKPTNPEAFVEKYGEALGKAGGSAMGIFIGELAQIEVEGLRVTQVSFNMDVAKLTEAMGAAGGAAGDPEGAEMMRSFLERMYPPEGMRLSLASRGEHAVMVLGGDDAFLRGALRRLQVGGSPPPADLARALERVGAAHPSFVMRFDVAALLAGMSELFTPMLGPGVFPDVSDLSAPVTVYAGVEGLRWHGGSSSDSARMGALVRRLSQAGQAPAVPEEK